MLLNSISVNKWCKRRQQPVTEQERPLSQGEDGPTDEEFLRIPPTTDDPLTLMPPVPERSVSSQNRRQVANQFSLFSDDEENEEEARRRRPIIRVNTRSGPTTLTNPNFEDEELAVDTENGAYDT